MTSVAQRKRAKRFSRAIAPAARRTKPTLAVDNSPKPIARESGLDWLIAKKRITRQHHAAGMRWGVHYRLCQVDGLSPLRSCLNDSPHGGATGAGFAYAAQEAEAKEARAQAKAALHWQDDMINALDAVCGRQLTPWEHVRALGGKQRDVEELQTTLRLALDMLRKHYRL